MAKPRKDFLFKGLDLDGKDFFILEKNLGEYDRINDWKISSRYTFDQARALLPSLKNLDVDIQTLVIVNEDYMLCLDEEFNKTLNEWLADIKKQSL